MMAAALPETAPHLAWPPEAFFWSLVDAPPRTNMRAGPLPIGLAPAFEEDVPAAFETLHAVCAPWRARADAPPKMLVCAARKERLAGLPASALSLRPSGPPPFLAAPRELPAINLLVGAFEPRAARRARVRTRGLGLATILGCALVVSWGLLRRAHLWVSYAAAARAAESAVVAQVLPGGNGDSLRRELAALRGRAGPSGRAPDAALVLASLLAGWPRGVECKVQSISAGPASAAIAATMEGDPSPFLEGLRAPPGWSLEEPQISSQGGIARLLLVMKPITPPETPR